MDSLEQKGLDVSPAEETFQDAQRSESERAALAMGGVPILKGWGCNAGVSVSVGVNLFETAAEAQQEVQSYIEGNKDNKPDPVEVKLAGLVNGTGSTVRNDEFGSAGAQWSNGAVQASVVIFYDQEILNGTAVDTLLSEVVSYTDSRLPG